jgi:ribosomal protein L21E
MNKEIKLLDVVALTADVPEHNLSRGQVGTVVDLLKNGTAYEVEFSDREGRTYKSLGLRPEQLLVLHYEPDSDIREPLAV